MWICLNDSFLSIVADRDDKTMLLVRARAPGHIEAVFGDKYRVYRPEGRADYQFRANIPRVVVSSVIGELLAEIDYGNFKDSVRDDALHDAYMGFWTIMYRLQQAALAKLERAVGNKRQTLLKQAREKADSLIVKR
jgi:chorismate synthase